jgi:nucleoside phosphorylase
MLTIYTDRFIPERFGAVNAGPVSLIRPKYKGDAGLHAHEAVHARQWLAMAAIGPVSAAIVYLAQIERQCPTCWRCCWCPACCTVFCTSW